LGDAAYLVDAGGDPPPMLATAAQQLAKTRQNIVRMLRADARTTRTCGCWPPSGAMPRWRASPVIPSAVPVWVIWIFPHHRLIGSATGCLLINCLDHLLYDNWCG
jgi:hypothetical protein